MTTLKETKEVVEVRNEVQTVLKTAQSVSIKSDEDYKMANEELVVVKKTGKKIADLKNKQIKPLNEALKATRDFWKPFEDQYKEAEQVLKKAILTYKAKVDARNARKEATISKNVQEGKISFEKGVEKIQTIQEAPATHAGVKARTIKKVQFLPVSEMNDTQILWLAKSGYLVWDEVKGRREALAGVQIPGAKVYEEEVLAV